MTEEENLAEVAIATLQKKADDLIRKQNEEQPSDKAVASNSPFKQYGKLSAFCHRLTPSFTV